MSKILAIPIDEKNFFQGDINKKISSFLLYEIIPYSSTFKEKIDVNQFNNIESTFGILFKKTDYVLIKYIDEAMAQELEKKYNFEFVLVSVEGSSENLATAFAMSYTKITGETSTEGLYNEDYKKNPLGDRIIAALKDVIDIEVGLSVWDFGLIRDFYANENTGEVSFTFIPSAPTCPLAYQLGKQIKDVVKSAGGKNIKIKVLNFVEQKKLEDYINSI